ncbi:hypothetical protein [Candidatus Parabeggiatoa sp. HSG14]|uniref:hypothetical protein n=1 Tax=Candidatus Parabeggiatoa sp. HSG14 TaxID=3055593 RepID=UPI0025A8429B|nr:hypothetical protein [Thiotrichales bacterium HSG14]
MKNIILAITLLTISLSAWSSELYTPNPVLYENNEKIIATVKFDTPETGDLYVAAVANGKLLFLSQTSGWTETPSPFRANETFQGEVPLFSVEAGQLPSGNYPLYQVVTKPNAKLLNDDGSPNVGDWIGGIDGLNFINFSTGLSKKARVLAFNDLGMHCMNKNFSIFAILPPFNVVNAQVVQQDNNGKPKLLDDSQVELRYSAIPDRKGSINSSSVTKTDFWQYSKDLFNMDLQPGEGLTGLYMPADDPKNFGSLHYKTQQKWFSADGIPITPIDDAGQVNAYPLLRISAHDKTSGELLGAADVVVPVSTEVNCDTCHATGKIAANNPDITWTTNNDPDVQAQKDDAMKLEVQAQKNVLVLHDNKHNTSLLKSTPVLCASCHYSAALDLTGEGPQGMQKLLPTSSQVMHKAHGEKLDAEGNPVISTDAKVEENCYQCHPGKVTQCQRGAMKTVGLKCTTCHGGLLAVGGKFPLQKGGSVDGTNDGKARRAWMDMPRCQSCHTGDAVNQLTGEGLEFHTDSIRLIQAYKTGDDSASPILAENKRFAEEDNTLFRNSKGHGEIACEGCHGSPHAIWPIVDTNANDNLTALQLQSHIGTVIECDTCHAPDSLPMTMEGPHGMHNVNDSRWVEEHKEFYKRGVSSCKACHGKNLEGTPLSKIAATRTFEIEENDKKKTITLEKGQQVGCGLCHNKP